MSKIAIKNRLEDKFVQFKRQFGSNFLDKKLKNYFHTQLIYISSKFEKVEITQKAVEEIVEHFPKKPKSKNPNLLQAYGQKKALEFIEESAKDSLLSANIIPEIHFAIFEFDKKVEPGRFRTDSVQFAHTEFMTALPFMIGGVMGDFGNWLREKQAEMDTNNVWEILKFATEAHYKIVEIHPFKDGNGRVARIFFNLILRHYQLPYVVIPKTVNDARMLTTLQAGNHGDLIPLTEFLAELSSNSLDIVFAYYKNQQNWQNVLMVKVT